MSPCANSVSDESEVFALDMKGNSAGRLDHHQLPFVQATEAHVASSFALGRNVRAVNFHLNRHWRDCHMRG